MFDAIRDAKDMIMTAIMIILFISFIGSVTTCTYYREDTLELTQSIEKQKLEYAVLEQTYIAKAKAIEVGFKEQEIKAHEKYAEDLLSIAQQSSTNDRIIDRVQHHTTETIKYLPNMERSALEEVAISKSELLIEGATLLGEADQIARQYSAELDLCYAKYPKNLDDASDISE